MKPNQGSVALIRAPNSEAAKALALRDSANDLRNAVLDLWTRPDCRVARPFSVPSRTEGPGEEDGRAAVGEAVYLRRSFPGIALSRHGFNPIRRQNAFPERAFLKRPLKDNSIDAL